MRKKQKEPQIKGEDRTVRRDPRSKRLRTLHGSEPARGRSDEKRVQCVEGLDVLKRAGSGENDRTCSRQTKENQRRNQ